MATSATARLSQKMEAVKNLFLSGLSEEFIALQLDLEIPVVIKILKDLEVYRPDYVSD
jgi:hypothetical protein